MARYEYSTDRTTTNRARKVRFQTKGSTGDIKHGSVEICSGLDNGAPVIELFVEVYSKKHGERRGRSAFVSVLLSQEMWEHLKSAKPFVPPTTIKEE